MGMDEIDASIIEILQKFGRITMKELGHRVGLTSPATIERVKKLEENGIITGYCAEIDLKKVGLPIEAIILVTTEHGSCREFAAFAREHPHIMVCHRVTGDACYLVKVAVADMDGLEKVINDITTYGRTQTYIILSSPVSSKHPSRAIIN